MTRDNETLRRNEGCNTFLDVTARYNYPLGLFENPPKRFPPCRFCKRRSIRIVQPDQVARLTNLFSVTHINSRKMWIGRQEIVIMQGYIEWQAESFDQGPQPVQRSHDVMDVEARQVELANQADQFLGPSAYVNLYVRNSGAAPSETGELHRIAPLARGNKIKDL